MNWFQRGASYFRPRESIKATAFQIAALTEPMPPLLCDYVDTQIVRATVHEARFSEEQITITVADLYICLCRVLGIEKSHLCLEAHGVDAQGYFCSAKIRAMIHRVVTVAVEHNTRGLQNTFLEKLKFSVETVRNGGGGMGAYARSTSRLRSSSPAPNPPNAGGWQSASRAQPQPQPHQPQPQPQPHEPQPEPEPQTHQPQPQPQPQPHQPQPQPQPQQSPTASQDSEMEALRSEVAELRERLRRGETASPARNDAVTALMIDRNATWIATDSPLFAAVFEPHTGILGKIPPMSVPMEYKAELLNALAIMANLASVAAIASGVRSEWMTYVASQVPEGQSISTSESFAITAGPLIETLLLLMRFAYEKGIAAAKNGSAPKSFAHHNLVKLARVAHGNTMSVTVFKDVWNGKPVFTVVNGAQCLLRLN